MLTTLTTEEKVTLIPGPTGQLEILVGHPTEKKRDAWGIICHPHPLYGGTMYNKVVTTLVKAFQALGVSTVRFNFRGIGQSTGQFDQGEGELYDLLAVIDWVQQQTLKQELWLGGFSFGAYVAARAATQLPVSRLVTIAPPVEHFPMQTLAPINVPWIVVQGLKDEVVPPTAVLQWVETRKPKPLLITFPEAGHFFHGQLGELRMRLEEALQS